MKTSKTEKVKKEKKSVKKVKQTEFEVFIKLVESGVPIESWKSVAADLGVVPETISDWKKTEEYKKARRVTIELAIQSMKDSGSKDWRMWDRYLKLLEVDAVEKVDITSGGQPLTKLLLDIDGGTTSLSGIEKEVK